MKKIKNIHLILHDEKIITSFDYQLIQYLLSKINAENINKNYFSFIICWLCIHIRSGNICINLADVTTKNVKKNINLDAFKKINDLINLDLEWSLFLNENFSFILNNENKPAPLVLHNNHLYFQRMWQDLLFIANYFNYSLSTPICTKQITDQKTTKQMLLKLFDKSKVDEINWQLVATAIAITNKVTIISGGPGTGKTTAICKVLAALIMTQQENQLRIISAAPTGKAVARLTESLSNVIATLDVPESVKSRIPTEAITIHRLLGARSGFNHFKHNQTNLLNVDLLIIDEASMIDLKLMAAILCAMPSNAHLILLGDKDQLSSVEAGSIFGDLCDLFNGTYSENKAKKIKNLTDINVITNKKSNPFTDNICFLQKSYRFNDKSGIGNLARNINQGNTVESFKILKNDYFKDINYKSKQIFTDEFIINECLSHYQQYLTQVQKNPDDVIKVFSLFNQFRILCALKETAIGTININAVLEQRLQELNLINKNKHDIWYAGRPVMILKNNPSLGLFNGDIGITLPDKKANNNLRVFFILSNNQINQFLPFSLPKNETTFAMTIHKSQGSEFDNVAIILPNESSPILTKSLLYTAITRAKKNVLLFGNDEVLNEIINNKTKRLSGLAHLLKLE